MSQLLIGDDIDESLTELNKNLRNSTLRDCCKTLGVLLPHYSPWQSAGTQIATTPADLCRIKPEVSGGLITDNSSLKSMAEFMQNDCIAAISNLPGKRQEWLPSSDGISNHFDPAYRLLHAHDVTKLLYKEFVQYVIPLGGGRNRGYSTHYARGAIFRSLPCENNEFDVALDLFHEIGHQVLMLWQSVDPILLSDHNQPVYSQIRKRDRPAIQTYHATVALAYMRYLEIIHANNLGLVSAAKRRGETYNQNLSYSLHLAAVSIRENCKLSDIGDLLLQEMEALI